MVYINSIKGPPKSYFSSGKVMLNIAKPADCIWLQTHPVCSFLRFLAMVNKCEQNVGVPRFVAEPCCGGVGFYGSVL